MTNLTTVPTDFTRDRWKRPLIIPPGGGKPVAYRRCTSYVDVLADKFKLQQWDKRMVAIGLAQRDDLRLSVLAHLNDKDELNRICDAAKEYAKASAAATQGTAFHSLTDIVDMGADLPDGLPDNVTQTLDAFRAATRDLKTILIEPKSCLDTHRVAGTPDRVYEYRGQRYIGDTKTGTIRFGTLKIAAQLAVYSRSWLYDVKTGERTTHGASTTRGIIMDVDLEARTVEPVWIDLEAGWASVQVARQVWDQRSGDKFADLTEPFGPPARPSLRAQKVEEDRTAEAAESQAQRLERMVLACPTADAVRELWAVYAAQWTDHLTEVAKSHIANLPTAS